MKRKFLLSFLLVLVVFSVSFSSQLVGEIFVEYDGTSNLNLLTEKEIYVWSPDNGVIIRQTSLLTHKEERIWTFKFAPEEYFEHYSLNIYFPGNAEIIGVTSGYTLSVEGKRIQISFKGEGYPDLEVKYRVTSPKGYTSILTLFLGILFLVLSILLLISIVLSLSLKKKGYEGLKYLSDTEKLIVFEIKKNKKGVKQSELKKLTKLPKATLSRTITGLRNKGIIQVEKVGITNFIRLK